jgi:transcription initiation factor TFIIIB Brf1 subunit/transcription initiation factor TFIIB
MCSTWDSFNLLKTSFFNQLAEPSNTIKDQNINEIKTDYLDETDLLKTTDTDNKCPDCNIAIISNDQSGYFECPQCNYIKDGVILSSAVNNNTNNTNSYAVTSINSLLPQSSMSTNIGYTNNSKFNNIKRLKKWAAMPSNERSLYNSIKDIQSHGEKTNIKQSIIDTSIYIYKLISDKENFILTRGLNREALKASCVYYACQSKNEPRSDIEIASMYNINVTDLTKGRNLFIKIIKKKNIILNTIIISPLHYIERFCNMVNVEDEHIKLGKFMAYRCSKLGISDKHTALSISAGILYSLNIFFNYGLQKDKLHKISGVSYVTVSKCFKNILINRHFIIPKKYRETVNYLINYEKRMIKKRLLIRK